MTARIIFKGSSGLNVKVDPVRLRFDPETGIQDLAVAVNIDHDRTGRVSRRKGYSATAITDPVYSLWCDGGACLFVTGGNLCQLFADYSSVPIVAVASNRLTYFQLENRSYWMDGVAKGFIEDSVNYPWVMGDYVGPDTTRQLSDPPAGHLIAYSHGRAWVAQGPVVWYSDPFYLNAFDLARNFLPFESRITMLHPVKKGLFISDQNRVTFVQGADPKQMEPTVVAHYPAIAGTATPLELGKFADGSLAANEITGAAVIWASPEGICIGTHDGRFFNITRDRLVYPLSHNGSGLIMESRYVVTLEP